MIREGLGVRLVLRKAVYLPRLAEKTAGPAILWTLTLVIRHVSRPRVCHLRGDADAGLLCVGFTTIEDTATFLRPSVLGLFCVVGHKAQPAFRSAAIFSAK